MSSASERRRERRYPVNVRVRWRSDGESNWQEASFLTAGPGGAFLKTDESIATGSRIELEVPVAEQTECVIAEVMWRADTRPNGFGLRYIDLSETLRDRILDEIVDGHWLRG